MESREFALGPGVIFTSLCIAESGKDRGNPAFRAEMFQHDTISL